jgi:hypothetical protein
METALTNGTAPGLYVREGDDTSDWETYRQVLARRVEEAVASQNLPVGIQLQLLIQAVQGDGKTGAPGLLPRVAALQTSFDAMTAEQRQWRYEQREWRSDVERRLDQLERPKPVVVSERSVYVASVIVVPAPPPRRAPPAGAGGVARGVARSRSPTQTWSLANRAGANGAVRSVATPDTAPRSAMPVAVCPRATRTNRIATSLARRGQTRASLRQ